MTGGSTTEDPRIGKVLDRFREAYRRGAPFTEDRSLTDELALEARPCVESLLFALEHVKGPDVLAPELREAFAMLTLLGRRAGELSATPTAALSLTHALVTGLEETTRVAPELRQAVHAVAMEGYVSGREERLLRDARIRAAEAQPILELVPQCLALVLRGLHEPDQLQEIVDRFGRRMLAAGAVSCVVDVEGLEGPEPERAVEVFAADATARMLGALAVFAGVSPEWLAAAKRARLHLDLVAMAPSFSAAATVALERAGFPGFGQPSLVARLRAFARRY